MSNNTTKFHVFMAVQKTGRKISTPVFVYVGTPEEASVIGMDLQKKLDDEDKVRSKMQRKRDVRIDLVEGQIGQKVLEKLVSTPVRIGVDLASPDGDHSAYTEITDGVITAMGTLIEHDEEGK